MASRDNAGDDDSERRAIVNGTPWSSRRRPTEGDSFGRREYDGIQIRVGIGPKGISLIVLVIDILVLLVDVFILKHYV